MFNVRMKSDVLGIVVVLSVDGSNDGGTLGGHFIMPLFIFRFKTSY